MSSPVQIPVNSQVVDALKVTKKYVSAPDVIANQGWGMAYLSIAQTTALAVQDAADILRNIGTMGSVALGVAVSSYLESQNNSGTASGGTTSGTGTTPVASSSADTTLSTAITDINTMMQNASENFQNVGNNAASVLQKFQQAAPAVGGSNGNGDNHI